MRQTVFVGPSAAVWLRLAFVATAVTWAASLPLAPFLAGGPAGGAGYWPAFVVYEIGSLVCHQRPERSFHLGAAQWPVCARCTGVYVGAAAAALIGVLPFGSGVGGTARAARIALVLSIVPSALTLAYEWTTGATPSNWIRAAAGLPMGAVVAWLIVRAVGAEPLRPGRTRPARVGG